MSNTAETFASSVGDASLTEQQRFVRVAYLSRLGPVAFSVLLVQLCSIVNNLIVGRVVGGDGLAVMSAVNPVYFVFATLGALLTTGGSTLAARRIGQNNARQADQAFTLSVLVMVFVGLLLTFGGLASRDALLSLLGVPEALRPLARDYLTAYLPGAIGVMGVYVPFNYLKLIGKQNLSVVLFLVMAAVNVGLDLLLAGSMGMSGVALATSAGAWAAFLFGLLLLVGRGRDFRFRIGLGAASTLGQIVRFGSPSAVNNLCNVLRTLLLNHIILGAQGSAGLAAFSLVSTARSFSMSISNGASMTMAPFAAVFSGERDSESLRQLLRCALIAGAALMCVFSGLLFAFAEGVCALFSVTAPETLAVAVPALRVFALSLPVAVLNAILIAFHANGGRTLLSNALTLCQSLAFVVGFALLLSRLFGSGALWTAFPVSEVCTLALALVCALLYSRRHAHVSKLALIDTLAKDEGRYIAFSVEPTDAAAAESAEKISAFCEQNALPPKTVMAISLSIEELLTLMNRRALTSKGKHSSGSSVRVLIYRDDQVILRIRCAGRSFDPLAAAEAGEDEAQEYLGVRMLRKLAKSASYTHTFGVNNLTITL